MKSIIALHSVIIVTCTLSAIRFAFFETGPDRIVAIFASIAIIGASIGRIVHLVTSSTEEDSDGKKPW